MVQKWLCSHFSNIKQYYLLTWLKTNCCHQLILLAYWRSSCLWHHIYWTCIAKPTHTLSHKNMWVDYWIFLHLAMCIAYSIVLYQHCTLFNTPLSQLAHSQRWVHKAVSHLTENEAQLWAAMRLCKSQAGWTLSLSWKNFKYIYIFIFDLICLLK